MTSWILLDGEWIIDRVEMKIPGLGIFISTNNIPDSHIYVFNVLSDAVKHIIHKNEGIHKGKGGDTHSMG